MELMDVVPSVMECASRKRIGVIRLDVRLLAHRCTLCFVYTYVMTLCEMYMLIHIGVPDLVRHATRNVPAL
jgi:hypothetical protein